MHLLADLARTELAVRLLTRNARISIAHYESGLPLRRLRDLYHELHHRKPSSGQLPAMGCPAIRTRRRQIHASLFATVYEARGGPRVYQATDGAGAGSTKQLDDCGAPGRQSLETAWPCRAARWSAVLPVDATGGGDFPMN